MKTWNVFAALSVAAVAAGLSPAFALDIGQVKVARGVVYIERAGQRLPVEVGSGVQPSDTVVTGADGSVGITFTDNTMMSAGPNSNLAIDRFWFDSTTHAGAFETSVKRGTLSVVSGKIAKNSPDAMRVSTPAAILGVRGTEFFVQIDETGP